VFRSPHANRYIRNRLVYAKWIDTWGDGSDNLFLKALKAYIEKKNTYDIAGPEGGNQLVLVIPQETKY